MYFCTQCNNTGSTTADGYLDCAAPGCTAAADRIAFDKWLLQNGYPQSSTKDWHIYRHAVQTAVESLDMAMKENDRLRSTLEAAQARVGGLTLEKVALEKKLTDRAVAAQALADRALAMNAEVQAGLVNALKEYKRMYEQLQPAGGWQGVYEDGNDALTAAGATL